MSDNELLSVQRYPNSSVLNIRGIPLSRLPSVFERSSGSIFKEPFLEFQIRNIEVLKTSLLKHKVWGI